MDVGFDWVPAVAPAPAPPNSPPLDDAGVAAAFPPPNVDPVLPPPRGAAVVAPPPNGEDAVAFPPPNRDVGLVGFAEVGFAKLNPPPVDVPPLAGCALPKRLPDAGAVAPKGEGDAPELFAAFVWKLNPDMADAGVGVDVDVDGWRVLD
jgi:hypothetical protein